MHKVCQTLKETYPRSLKDTSTLHLLPARHQEVLSKIIDVEKGVQNTYPDLTCLAQQCRSRARHFCHGAMLTKNVDSCNAMYPKCIQVHGKFKHCVGNINKLAMRVFKCLFYCSIADWECNSRVLRAISSNLPCSRHMPSKTWRDFQLRR